MLKQLGSLRRGKGFANCVFNQVQTFSVSQSQELPPVIVEKNGVVTTIIINRPHRKNAINLTASRYLADAMREFEVDSNARVGVLCGIGSFCSGADLRSITEGEMNRMEDDGDAPLGPSRMELSKPMIAAVSGAAVAGGMELALWY